MPYHAVHLMFFIFCISRVGVFAIVSSGFRQEIGLKDMKHFLLLFVVGSIGSVFPDVPAV